MNTINSERVREMSSMIVDMFEELLDDKGIYIPCEDEDEQNERFNDGNDAKLYGMEYWHLIDMVEGAMKTILEEHGVFEE